MAANPDSYWPDLNRISVDPGIDGTPGADYPLRILRAYRQKAEARWLTEGLPEVSRTIWHALNEHQQQRADALDRAIALLEASDG